MQAKNYILSLMAVLVFQSAWAGGSGDSCTSHDTRANGGGESEIWRDGSKSYGCNCNKNADMYVGTDYEAYDDKNEGKGYPYVGKCMSTNGGMWSKTEKPCYPGQPLEAKTDNKMQGRPAREGMGTCWEIWCTETGKYFIGILAANGTRTIESVRFDECKSCPAAQVLEMKTDENTATITFKIVKR